MFRILRGNCCTKHGESRRMYPARQIKSTPCCLSAATTSRSCCSRGLSFDGMTSALSPRWRAVVIPGASGLLEMTTAMRASGIRPASMLSAMATKLEPRPERRMPREFMGFRLSAIRCQLSAFSRSIIVHPHSSPAGLLVQETRREPDRSSSAVHYLAFTFDDAADGVGFFSHAFEHGLGF